MTITAGVDEAVVDDGIAEVAVAEGDEVRPGRDHWSGGISRGRRIATLLSRALTWTTSAPRSQRKHGPPRTEHPRDELWAGEIRGLTAARACAGRLHQARDRNSFSMRSRLTVLSSPSSAVTHC